MSRENAIRFMMMKDKDEGLKNAFDAVMGKYEGIILSKDDQDQVFREEIIPFAREYGYDLSPEDLGELQTEGKLSEEELDQITGGKGETSCSYSIYGIYGPVTMTVIDSCDYAPDNETFINRFTGWPDANCPDYVYCGSGPDYRRCPSCAHLILTVKRS